MDTKKIWIIIAALLAGMMPVAAQEGIFLGYRGVEHFGVEPLYPFGYGLSYTSFEYSDISVVKAGDGFDVSFTVHLGPDAFSYYDVSVHGWKVDPGEYRILVGASSADIRLEASLKI